jgi:hypothetical protein
MNSVLIVLLQDFQRLLEASQNPPCPWTGTDFPDRRVNICAI